MGTCTSSLREVPGKLEGRGQRRERRKEGWPGPTDLPLGEVVLAEPLPQQPVLAEHMQVGAHLAQADQVAPITQPLHDVQL